MASPGAHNPGHPTMSVLRSIESKLAGLVEGTFGRVFKSEVRPVELARGLVKEMEQHKTVSVSRVYVPNEYVVWLSPEDRQRFDGVEHDIADELAAYVLEHARREKLALVSRPQVTFETDDNLKLGEFGIQARLVRAAGPAGAAPEQAGHGQTMVYSTAGRVQDPLEADKRVRRGRAFLLAEGKRMPVPEHGAVIGRSRECDIVLADSNVSRRHAEIRPAGPGWTVGDLGSTNGVRVNGRRVGGEPMPVQDGDRIELGTVAVGVEVE